MENIQNKEISAIEKFELFWLLVLTCDLFMNYLPSVVYYLTLILLIIRSSRIELSFILIFFPGIMFIDALNNSLFDGNKALLILLFLGIIIIFTDIWCLRSEIFQCLLPLLVILLGFLITYIYAPKGYYSGYKIVAVITRGFANFLFFIVFIRTKNFNNIRFSLLLLFLFIFFLKIAYTIGVVSIPGNILDIGFIRRNLDETLYLGFVYPSYHQFGALPMFAIIFFLAGIKRLNWLSIFIIIICLYFGFLSGARQMIFGIILVLTIFIIKYWRKNLAILIPSVFLMFTLITLTTTEIKVPFISDFLINEEVIKDDGRFDLYKEAISIFEKEPLLGAGIGGFDPTGTSRNYPHNILLEVLAEGGLFMFSLIIFTIYFVKKRSEYKWWSSTVNGTIFLFLIIGFTIRAFSSSDLIENIALISALIAIGIYRTMPGLDEMDTTIYSIK